MGEGKICVICGGSGIMMQMSDEVDGQFDEVRCGYCVNGLDRRLPGDAVMTKEKWDYVVNRACEIWDKRSQR